MAGKDQIEAALKWLNHGHIQVDGKDIFELKSNHQRAILRCIHKSSDISNEVCCEMLEKILKDDKSDLAKGCRFACEASSSKLEDK